LSEARAASCLVAQGLLNGAVCAKEGAKEGGFFGGERGGGGGEPKPVAIRRARGAQCEMVVTREPGEIYFQTLQSQSKI
jgi:hypothetical protein